MPTGGVYVYSFDVVDTLTSSSTGMPLMLYSIRTTAISPFPLTGGSVERLRALIAAPVSLYWRMCSANCCAASGSVLVRAAGAEHHIRRLGVARSASPQNLPFELPVGGEVDGISCDAKAASGIGTRFICPLPVAERPVDVTICEAGLFCARRPATPAIAKIPTMNIVGGKPQDRC